MQAPHSCPTIIQSFLSTQLLLTWFDEELLQVIKDCKVALEHDSQSVKGYFFMGQSDVELENFEEAVIHLTKGDKQLVAEYLLSIYFKPYYLPKLFCA